MKFLFSVLTVVVGMGAQSAFACSCAPYPPVADAVDGSTAVFTGTVTEINKLGAQSEQVKFKVKKNYKGLPWQANSAVYGTIPNGANCGYFFKQGETYLVYSHLDLEGRLSTNICTRTKSAGSKEGKEEIEEIEKL